jgi:superfamily I DNA/RNA helicase
VFVGSEEQLERARAAMAASGASSRELTDKIEASSDQIAICTMHVAKGLKFRAVAVMACDDDILPLQSRIETVADDADLGSV